MSKNCDYLTLPEEPNIIKYNIIINNNKNMISKIEGKTRIKIKVKLL